ncbi:MAG: methyltransferase domain-containing protein [Leptolyngbyaceae cyanobacterium bins.302]|nr:methyltransferase domain-containing protein [Leptolyngbyaceae cyanobacterium bins.302]
MIVDKSDPAATNSPNSHFQSDHYQRHNHRRLEHLATLGLNIHNSTVLEVGAGIGDHTSFFVDRQCQVTSVEAREENLNVLRLRYPELDTRQLDLDNPEFRFEQSFDIVYCYGLLYHLKRPAEALEYMASHCSGMLLLETCVSYGDEEAINLCDEAVEDPTQSYWGQGCRPTRKWIYNQLQGWFKFVYMPNTQPNHEEFPIDWECPPPSSERLNRSIFVASRKELHNVILVPGIPMKQTRY